MNGYEAYRLFLALKRHFTSDYDFFKYNGKVTASVASFERRGDRFQFDKLARQRDPRLLLVANMIRTPNVWIGDVLSSDGLAKGVELQSAIEAASYRMAQEMKRLKPVFNDNLAVVDGRHPHIVAEYLASRVSITTIAAVVEVTGAMAIWDKSLSSDPTWATIGRTIKKSTPFLGIDKAKTISKIMEVFPNGIRE